MSLLNPKAHRIALACVKIASDAQGKADEFLAGDLGTRLWKEKRYFRFNVEQGLQDIQLEEYKEKEKMAAMTTAYLSRKDRGEEILECAKRLLPSAASQVLC